MPRVLVRCKIRGSRQLKERNFDKWPDLTPYNVHKYLPTSDVSVKRHMYRHGQYIRSTLPESEAEDPVLEMEQEGKYHAVYVAVIQAGQNYTDLTSRFPQQYSSGNTYILVLHHYACDK
jgi:hypothetical protein